MFSCGWLYCQHGAQFREADIHPYINLPGSYGCVALSGTCGTNPTCACLTGFTGNCTVSANGDLSVYMVLWQLIKEFVEHYMMERFHQGLGGQLIRKQVGPMNDNGVAGAVVRRSRRGGMPIITPARPHEPRRQVSGPCGVIPSCQAQLMAQLKPWRLAQACLWATKK
jgi:hypothetical protein